MLVDADTVEAGLVGKLELVEVVVVGDVADGGIEQLGRRKVDPHAVIALPEVVGQVGIRHEMEEVELHDRASRNSVMATMTASGASLGSMCAPPGTIVVRQLARAAAKSWAYWTGTKASSSPWITSVGARTR